MTIPKVIVSMIVSLIIGIAVGYLLRWYLKPDHGQIIEETPPKQTILYVPKNCDEYKKCYDTDLELEAIMSNNWLLASCTNKCKETQRAFKIESEFTVPKNIPSIGLMTLYTDKRIKVLGGAGYDRVVWRSLFVGGMGFSNGEDHAVIVRAGLTF